MDDTASGQARTSAAGSLSALLGGAAAQAQRSALRLTLAALEHLLRQQQWARERLKAHAGATIRVGVDAAPLPGLAPPDWRLKIDDEGYLRPDAADAAPAASLLLRPSVDAVFAALRDGAEGLSRHLRIEGDAMLAATVGELARHLRWEPEEDLSRVVGDVAARRIAGLARGGGERLREIGERAASAVSENVAGEQRQLLTRPLAHWLRDGAAGLEARVAALEARVERLRRRS